MLVLSRQIDETIMIGDDVEITIVDIRGEKVRIGISAPNRVSVHRKEVYDAIKSENQNAAGALDAASVNLLMPGPPGPHAVQSAAPHASTRACAPLVLAQSDQLRTGSANLVTRTQRRPAPDAQHAADHGKKRRSGR